MQKLASELRFEEAQTIKEKYEIIENYRSKSTVVTPSLHNIDVFSITENEHSAYINYLHIGNGAVVQAYTFEYKMRLEETKEELLSLGIIEMRNRFNSTAKEIILPYPIDIELENVTITVPQRGDKKKLLELSEMNVRQYKVDKLKQAEKLNPEQRSTRLLKEIQDTLKLPKLPVQIECFDNSNIQGSDAVAACLPVAAIIVSMADCNHLESALNDSKNSSLKRLNSDATGFSICVLSIIITLQNAKVTKTIDFASFFVHLPKIIIQKPVKSDD